MRATSKKENSTKANLQGTPFQFMSELKREQKQIRYEVWRRMSEAKIISELLEKREFEFMKDEFRRGIECSFGETEDVLVRVFSDGEGIKD